MIKKYGLAINSTYYDLDYIKEFKVSEISELTTFPLVTKIQVGDHKFDKPKSITLSGVVSNNAKKFQVPYYDAARGIYYDKKDDKITYLTHIYDFFKKLKTHNAFLKVFSPNININNCVITSFSWSESGNDVADFSFTLNEVFTFEVLEVAARVLQPDASLPDLNDPFPQSAVETLLLKNTTEIDLIIFNMLAEYNLIDLREFGKKVGIALGALAVVGIVVTLGLLLGSNPVGWIILAAAAFAAFIAGVVAFFVRWINSRYYIQGFKVYKDKKKMDAELKRLNELAENIYKSLRKLDNHILSYSINSNEAQDLLISLNEKYFNIRFKKISQGSEGSASWNFEVLNTDDTVAQSGFRLIPQTSLFNCNLNNYHFKSGNFRLWFVYDLETVATKAAAQNKSIKDVNVNQIELSKVHIVISAWNIEKLSDIIGEAALANIRRK